MLGKNPLIETLFKATLGAIALLLLGALGSAGKALADASGTFVFTQRFDGEAIVKEVNWEYVRATPSLSFDKPRVIWSGAGAPEGQAGSDGMLYTPAGDLVVANWQAGMFWKFDPAETDEIVDPAISAPFAFHMLLHPNLDDFLATPALSGVTCNSGQDGCFAVHDHTVLAPGSLCLAPPESKTGDVLQPISFIADGELNIFALFTEGDTSIQFGGGGFASFDLGSTTSAVCGNDMEMTRLIPLGIEAAHSISWDPYLSDLSASPAQEAGSGNDTQATAGVPHSDFIVFANSRISHIQVLNPGAPDASASVVSTIDMATEAVCDSRLPGGAHEFDQGAVTGGGIVMVGDEANGFIALIDYRQNTNGTILDGQNTVCLTSLLSQGIDDIAPLTGLGSLLFEGPGATLNFGDGFEDP